MHISEIFYSIQGEGVNMGMPSIFLRLSGCNLRCIWCDTKHAWAIDSGKPMTIPQIIKKIKRFPCKHLIITGGEPLLQQENLKKLLSKLREYFIEIETNGSIQTRLGNLINQYNCSPKLKNSQSTNQHKTTLKKFPKLRTYYKFVVNKPADIIEIDSIIKKFALQTDRIILMPEGKTSQELNEKSKWLTEICKKKSFRFSPRLHINIWGNRKGK